jgi:hypothetical protein
MVPARPVAGPQPVRAVGSTFSRTPDLFLVYNTSGKGYDEEGGEPTCAAELLRC